MRLTSTTEPISDDDAAIRAALEFVEVPPLLAAVAHLTGDLSLLRADLRPDPLRLLEPEAGITVERMAEARDLAAAALVRYRDAGCIAAPQATEGALRTLVEYLVGEVTTEAYFPLLREELNVDGEDPRAPVWHKDTLAPQTPFAVAIIGAGMSGIVAAHRLQQAGVPFVMLEKNDDVGGTWLENVYPGCRVDVPNHFYSYSFAQTTEWPQFFSSQDVLLDYFRTCADAFDLRPHIRFGTEVLRADFSDDTQTWTIRTRDSHGEHVEVFQAVISAVGQLNRPSFPTIEGRERFAGDSFHSAHWDHSVDLTGRRVGIIGTGASAAQFIPRVGEQASSLVVFQRTAPWLVPTPNYHDDLPDGERWVLRHVPGYARWDRLWLFWRSHEGLLPAAIVDPEWQDQTRSFSAANDFVRELLTDYLRLMFPDDELFAKVLPDYAPLAKRFVRDNGIWAKTLGRDNVELCTESILEITEKGVRTADGVDHEVDVLIYGTGFSASAFLTPMTVHGVGGLDLHEQWDGNARAYLGVTVPNFPNLFLMYGPNTNIVINGSIIYFSECETHYIVECVRMLLERGLRSLDCTQEAHDAYNEYIDAANRARVWGASSVNSWYKNATGRTAQNWPFSLLEYWEQTRVPKADDYLLR